MTLCEIYKKVGSFPFVVDVISKYNIVDHKQIIITSRFDDYLPRPGKAIGIYYLATTIEGVKIDPRWSEWGQYEIPKGDFKPQATLIQVNVCTCGGAKINSTHSHWCDYKQKAG